MIRFDAVTQRFKLLGESALCLNRKCILQFTCNSIRIVWFIRFGPIRNTEEKSEPKKKKKLSLWLCHKRHQNPFKIIPVVRNHSAKNGPFSPFLHDSKQPHPISSLLLLSTSASSNQVATGSSSTHNHFSSSTRLSIFIGLKAFLSCTYV